jgi:hypothetical protein
MTEKETLEEAKKAEKPLTIEEKIQKVEGEVQQAQSQISEWNAVLLKKLGSLETLQEMLKE